MNTETAFTIRAYESLLKPKAPTANATGRTRVRAWLARGVLLLATLLGTVGRAKAVDTVTYYYTSPQGTVLATADAAGNLLNAPDYRPYGTQAKGTIEQGPGYAGHVTDAGTGLVYMQARYYDAQTGRFYSSDPVAVAAGNVFLFNRYAYANDNPAAYVDPTGMLSCSSSGEVSSGVQRMRDASDKCTNDGVSAVVAGTVAIGRGLSGAAPLEGAGIGLLRTSPLLMTLALSGDTTVNKDQIFVYVTYTRFNSMTDQYYAGRTRGYIRLSNPAADLTRIVNARAAGQPILNSEGFNKPVVDSYTDSYFAIRGREQQLIDFHGGARSYGGSARNMINGVNPTNIITWQTYMGAADAEFGGSLPNNSPRATP